MFTINFKTFLAFSVGCI